MKRTVVIAAVALAAFIIGVSEMASPAHAQQSTMPKGQPTATPDTPETAKAKADAKPVVEKWLALIDAGDYDTAWKETSQYFRDTVPQYRFVDGMKESFSKFGKLVSREARESKYATSIPGAPDGKYVAVVYRSSFQKVKKTAEYVTTMVDRDGKWRVGGYQRR
ncbi:MAG TPA: DUF4019 domain-containing protein [Candidatus Binataceae bacterium]|nr:DUF4019 domain-containing protein [Candidatus Binataceae bacterium]